jgi:hypothetical protein
VWFDAALIHGFCEDREERQKLFSTARDLIAKEEAINYQPRSPRLLAGDIFQESFRREFLSLLSHIEMTSQFR